MTEQELSAIPDIIDNSVEGQKLFDVLNSVLLPQVSADFATAYFNVPGFALVKDNLTRAKDFRLLLGKEPVVREPLTTGGGTTLIADELRGDTEDAMGHKETPAISLMERHISFRAYPTWGRLPFLAHLTLPSRDSLPTGSLILFRSKPQASKVSGIGLSASGINLMVLSPSLLSSFPISRPSIALLISTSRLFMNILRINSKWKLR